MGTVNITLKNNVEIYKYFSSIKTLINIYGNELGEEKESLINKEKQIRTLIINEIDSIDLIELESFCIKEWRFLFKKTKQYINKEINSRPKIIKIIKVAEFNNIKNELNSIQEDLIENIEEFETTYRSDIIRIRGDTIEKINNERFQILYPIFLAVLVLALPTIYSLLEKLSKYIFK